MGVREDALLLVYNGRLGPEKNLATLLRAFAGLRSAVPNAALLLLGDGPERSELEWLAENLGVADWLVFAGMVDYGRVPAFLAAGDLCVTTSLSEVHPLSVIEALACGLPVVGMDSPGVSDTIQHELNGLLSQPDLLAYTAQLTRIAVDRSLRSRLAEGARQSAQAYDIAGTSRELLDEYERLVASPRRERTPVWRQFMQHLRTAFR
jgi:glycosyltransferase involved in cell wall biosynthesis